MTPAAELWAAVVKHCATGRGYRMTLQSHPKATFVNVRNMRCADIFESLGKWFIYESGESAPHHTADEAVRAALRIVAPSTEPNVSC